MKNFLFLLALILISCNTSKRTYKLENTGRIVDNNQPYEYHEIRLQLNNSVKKQYEQTVILLNRQEIGYEKFSQLLKNKKINSIESILDKNKIENLGYSYKQVKRVLLTSS